MYVPFETIGNVLDVNIGLRTAVVPGTTTFIECVPADATVPSQVHVPLLSFVQLHDVGLVVPDSNDPFGAMLGTVAGNSRYNKPDNIPEVEYSTPLD